MIKLILSDVDETLIDKSHHVPLYNIEKIKEARSQGVKFALCTGRGPQYCHDILKELDLYGKEDEYMIGFNGALITNCKDFEPIFYHQVGYELSSQIFELGRKYHQCMIVFQREKCYIFNPSKLEVQRKIIQKANFEVMGDCDLSFLEGQDITKIIFSNPNIEMLYFLESEAQKLFKDKVSMTYSSGRYLEFNALNMNKGVGLKELAKLLHIDVEEVMAIGDNENDVEMIEAAGIGVAIKSGTANARKQANYITSLDYAEGAVGEAIENFVLGGKKHV